LTKENNINKLEKFKNLVNFNHIPKFGILGCDISLRWWLWFHAVMACQAALATTSLQDALKAGPVCLLTTLDSWKTSTMAQYSTSYGHGTLDLELGSSGDAQVT
jgi:hypothetical protein